MQLLNLLLIFLLACALVNTEADREKLEAELRLSALELQDDCENSAYIYKSSLLSNTFLDKATALKQHAHLLKSQSKLCQKFDEIPWELTRICNLLNQPGDVLLPKEKWDAFTKYVVETQELTHNFTVNCRNSTKDCTVVKKAYENLIATSSNGTMLKKSWEAWQTLLLVEKKKFPEVLSFVNIAATNNGQDNARSYWEMLLETEDAYDKADALWEQIKPLYEKLHKFVKTRIFNYYNITDDSSHIPVYFLGSNFGNEWHHILEKVLPKPQVFYDAQKYFSSTSVEDIYKIAESTFQKLGFKDFGDKFWKNSVFNMTFCENQIISFCSDEHTEIFTCNETSWKTYLEAFENGMDISLRNTDYTYLPRINLRYSVLDEALVSLMSTIAIKSLNNNDIVSQNVDKNTELLIIALNTLPKLPFYLLADKWRLDLLENSPTDFTSKWWDLRKDYQGVRGVFNNETDFLGDNYILSNRPYLSKFLGIVLQFQLIEFYERSITNAEDSLIELIHQNNDLLTMIGERSTKDWPNLLNNFYSINEISAEPLLNFFLPVENYLETAPLIQEKNYTTSRSTSKPINREIKKIEELKESSTIKITTQPTHHHPTISHHTVGPEPHRHYHEDLQEGNNPAMEHISVYIGIGLLIGVVAVILFAIAKKTIWKQKTNNNRRYQT